MTWNMQGAGSGTGTSNASDALSALRKGADVLLLQEAGGVPDWGLKKTSCGGVKLLHGFRNFGSDRKAIEAQVIWFDSTENTNAMHDRCSMGIIATNFSGTYGVVTHNSNGLRPLIGILTNDGVWVYNIHAPSGNHKAASGVAANLLGQIGGKEKFICAGDYNCTPADMMLRGFKAVSGGGATHQNGNTLDFAVGQKVTVTPYVSMFSTMPTLVSDHYSQCFSVQ
nr:endonuclease/exonuclease/phosphatase family protein [Azospirillum doebereinerae]